MTKEHIEKWIKNITSDPQCTHCLFQRNGIDCRRLYEDLGYGCGETVYLVLKDHFTPHWIPTTECLPEKSGLYLISCPSGVVKLASYDTDFEEFFDLYFDTYNTATAWQPLPEPYQEVKS